MCGISGIILSQGQYVSADDIRRMSDAMRHRGPDDLGYLGWRNGMHTPNIGRELNHVVASAEVALAHRRLAVIETSTSGWQPMTMDDDRYAITFNGEIYNYVELREELEAEGRTFRTNSDTEVLLQALAAWGTDKALSRLMGMFAFALLDTKANTVTLARDPFGIKPLYYAQLKDGLAFSSEVGSLLELSGVSRSIEPSALFDFLRFGFTDRNARTLFKSIQHLPQAHYAVIDLTKPTEIKPKRYWQIRLGTRLDISFEEASMNLRELFFDSVRLHMRSDIPVGAMLSGGIDSSAIISTMRAIMGASHSLHAFSFIAPGEDINEERWADLVGQHVNATMHKRMLTGEDLIRDFDKLIEAQAEPFGSSSIYAQNKVYSLAHDNGFKVLLDGQGADEILAGYVPYLATRLATLIKSGEWLNAMRFVSALDNNVGGAKGVAMRAMRFLLPHSLHSSARYFFGQSLLRPWMNEEWFEATGADTRDTHAHISEDFLRQDLLESLDDRVLPSLLRYQDRNSMRYSIESRVPFLNTKIVEFLFRLPEEYLISRDGVSKSVFRAAMQGVVPDVVLQRRDKIGFAIPEKRWLSELVNWWDDSGDGEVLSTIPAINGDRIKAEIKAMRSGEKPLTSEFWRWLSLVRWAKTFSVDFRV